MQLGLLQKYQGMLIKLCFVIFILSVIAFGILPAIGDISQTKQDIAVLDQKLAVLKSNEVLLQKQNRANLLTNAEKLDGAIGAVIDLPLILATLQEAAKTAKVEVGSFSMSSNTAAVTIAPVAQGGKLTIFQFKVDLGGGFDNMQNFLSRLAEATPLLRMDTIEFSKDKSSAIILFYFQPKATSAIQVDKAFAQLSKKEDETLAKVSALSPVAIGGATASATNAQRQNPFQ